MIGELMILPNCFLPTTLTVRAASIFLDESTKCSKNPQDQLGLARWGKRSASEQSLALPRERRSSFLLRCCLALGVVLTSFQGKEGHCAPIPGVESYQASPAPFEPTPKALITPTATPEEESGWDLAERYRAANLPYPKEVFDDYRDLKIFIPPDEPADDYLIVGTGPINPGFGNSIRTQKGMILPLKTPVLFEGGAVKLSLFQEEYRCEIEPEDQFERINSHYPTGYSVITSTCVAENPSVSDEEVRFTYILNQEMIILRASIIGANRMVVVEHEDPSSIDVLIEERSMPKDRICEHDALLPSKGPRDQLAATMKPSASNSADPIIDLLVAYSPKALGERNRIHNIVSAAEGAVAIANLAFKNSKVAVRLRIVDFYGLEDGLEMEDDPDESVWNSSLRSIRDADDGAHDVVHEIRDASGADLVAVLVKAPSESSISGKTYLFDPEDTAESNSSWGFSLNSIDSVDYTLAHEIGHNLGLHHDAENVSDFSPDTARGWRWTGDDGVQYRSIMAYRPGRRVPHFSNPKVFHQGQRTGDEELANNALHLKANSPAVSNYRESQYSKGARIEGQALIDGEHVPDAYKLYVNGVERPIRTDPEGNFVVFTGSWYGFWELTFDSRYKHCMSPERYSGILFGSSPISIVANSSSLVHTQRVGGVTLDPRLNPLPGVMVTLDCYSPVAHHEVVSSNASGVYQFSSVPCGAMCSLSAYSDRYQMMASTYNSKMIGPVNMTHDVVIGSRFHMHTMRGSVVTPKGKPIPNVRIYEEHSGESGFTTHSGDYIFSLQEGARYRIILSAPGYQAFYPPIVVGSVRGDLEFSHVGIEDGATLVTKLGDTNCDGFVDSADTDSFVEALFAWRYGLPFTDCPILNADCNQDGVVDTYDVPFFFDLLS